MTTDTAARRKLPIQFRPFWKGLVFVHRWLGIALCWLMLLWAVSGAVMMYVPFPELTDAERRQGASALDLERCCVLPLAADKTLHAPVVEMVLNRPTLRWSTGGRNTVSIDLETGAVIEGVSQDQAIAAAQDYIRLRDGLDVGATTRTIQEDQWSVYSRFHPHRPLHKISLDTAAGDVLYVSSRNGEIVQDTQAWERFWNWFGAVPHWVYYTILRKHQGLWYDFIVWASLLGSLVVAMGVYMGVRRLRCGQSRLSPYCGVMRWHHLTGVIFGALTFTWVLSGLFSMQPWGLMESEGSRDEVERAQLDKISVAEVRTALSVLQRLPGPADLVSIRFIGDQAAPADAILKYRDGRLVRVNASTLSAVNITEARIEDLLGRMRPNATMGSLSFMAEEDAYYYGHKDEVELPVWRAIMADAEATRYYFSGVTGELTAKVDRSARQYRWLHYGLHRFDFGATLRQRPVWDIVTLSFLLGVIFLCGLAVRVSVRRLKARIGRS